MSTPDVAADQLKCVRALSVILADRFGAKVEEKPHGHGGRVALHVTVLWQGVELHVWGPVVPEDDPRDRHATGGPTAP